MSAAGCFYSRINKLNKLMKVKWITRLNQALFPKPGKPAAECKESQMLSLYRHDWTCTEAHTCLYFAFCIRNRNTNTKFFPLSRILHVTLFSKDAVIMCQILKLRFAESKMCYSSKLCIKHVISCSLSWCLFDLLSSIHASK